MAPSEPARQPQSLFQELEEREQRVKLLRFRIQKYFLTPGNPTEANMAAMSEAFAALEKQTDLEREIIKNTKVDNILKRITKLDSIPKDAEFRFKKRAQDLLNLWDVDNSIQKPKDPRKLLSKLNEIYDQRRTDEAAFCRKMEANRVAEVAVRAELEKNLSEIQPEQQAFIRPTPPVTPHHTTNGSNVVPSERPFTEPPEEQPSSSRLEPVSISNPVEKQAALAIVKSEEPDLEPVIKWRPGEVIDLGASDSEDEEPKTPSPATRPPSGLARHFANHKGDPIPVSLSSSRSIRNGDNGNAPKNGATNLTQSSTSRSTKEADANTPRSLFLHPQSAAPSTPNRRPAPISTASSKKRTSPSLPSPRTLKRTRNEVIDVDLSDGEDSVPLIKRRSTSGKTVSFAAGSKKPAPLTPPTPTPASPGRNGRMPRAAAQRAGLGISKSVAELNRIAKMSDHELAEELGGRLSMELEETRKAKAGTHRALMETLARAE